MAENVTLNGSSSFRVKQAICSALLSILALSAGLVVLFLTFWFTYAIIWFGMLGISAVSELLFDKRLALTHVWRLATSAIFIVLLFIGNARTSREYLSDYSRVNRLRVVTRGAFLAYPDITAKMITDLLFTGPRLVVYAFRKAMHPFNRTEY